MKTIKERRKEILQWERENRNSNNRSVDAATKGCIYSGEIGCGVGRLVDDKDLCARLDHLAFSAVCQTAIFDQLPENVKELGHGFLMDLQRLHDQRHYWNENGLSDVGNVIIAIVETRWC